MSNRLRGWYGSSTVIGGEDCDDAESTVYPGASEIAGDGIDQDCDGSDATSGSGGCMSGEIADCNEGIGD